jgi:hypothetical protein
VDGLVSAEPGGVQEAFGNNVFEQAGSNDSARKEFAVAGESRIQAQPCAGTIGSSTKPQLISLIPQSAEQRHAGIRSIGVAQPGEPVREFPKNIREYIHANLTFKDY